MRKASGRRCYLTEYRSYLGTYGAEIWAPSWRQATRLAKQRGIGEKVIGYGPLMQAPPASFVLAKPKLRTGEALHALTWLAYLALASGRATARELFDDEIGIFHMLAHVQHLEHGRRTRKGATLWARLVLHVQVMEARVPGYPPANFEGRRPKHLRPE